MIDLVLLKAAILSMLPISELRGGIPYALHNGVSPLIAFLVCVIANIAIIPVVFLFLEFINSYLMHIKVYKSFFERFIERTRRKAHNKIEKYGYWGLIFFVAIPMPLTGAYTGAVAAWLFGLKKVKSFFIIALGVIIAGVIVTSVILFGLQALNMFIK